MNRYILFKQKQYYISMQEDFREEEKFYSGQLEKSDWKHLKKASELFLVHAYLHLFEILEVANKIFGSSDIDTSRVRVFGDDQDTIKYQQYYLNLAVGLELLCKSILLRKGIKINIPVKKATHLTLDSDRTISFGTIISEHLRDIFPTLIDDTVKEIEYTLRLINLKRNNLAHCAKKSYDSYAYEHRFSYITLYIYEKHYYGQNQKLTSLLLKSLKRPKDTQNIDYKPLRIMPRSLREGDST